MKLKTLIALFFIAIIVIFSTQNTEVIDVKVFFWKLSMSRVLVIFGSFAVGLIVGILVSIIRRRPPSIKSTKQNSTDNK